MFFSLNKKKIDKISSSLLFFRVKLSFIYFFNVILAGQIRKNILSVYAYVFKNDNILIMVTIVLNIRGIRGMSC